MFSLRAATWVPLELQLPRYVSTLPEAKGISKPQNNRWSTWCQRSVGWPESMGARLSKLIWGSSLFSYMLNRFPGIGFAQHWQHCDQPAAGVGRCYREGRQQPPVRWTARSASSSPVAIPTPRPGADFVTIWLWWCNVLETDWVTWVPRMDLTALLTFLESHGGWGVGAGGGTSLSSPTWARNNIGLSTKYSLKLTSRRRLEISLSSWR